MNKYQFLNEQMDNVNLSFSVLKGLHLVQDYSVEIIPDDMKLEVVVVPLYPVYKIDVKINLNSRKG